MQKWLAILLIITFACQVCTEIPKKSSYYNLHRPLVQEVSTQEIENGNNSTTTCSDVAKELAENLMTSLVSAISDCTSDSQRVIKDMFSNIVEVIISRFEQIQTHSDAIQKCNREDPDCFRKELAKYLETMKELIISLIKFRMKLENYITTTGKTCAKNVIILIDDNRNAIIDAFQKCISPSEEFYNGIKGHNAPDAFIKLFVKKHC